MFVYNVFLKGKTVTIKQFASRPLWTARHTDDRDTASRLHAPLLEFVNRRQWGNNCFPDSLDTAEIPFSVIPVSQLD